MGTYLRVGAYPRGRLLDNSMSRVGDYWRGLVISRGASSRHYYDDFGQKYFTLFISWYLFCCYSALIAQSN